MNSVDAAEHSAKKLKGQAANLVELIHKLQTTNEDVIEDISRSLNQIKQRCYLIEVDLGV